MAYKNQTNYFALTYLKHLLYNVYVARMSSSDLEMLASVAEECGPLNFNDYILAYLGQIVKPFHDRDPLNNIVELMTEPGVGPGTNCIFSGFAFNFVSTATQSTVRTNLWVVMRGKDPNRPTLCLKAGGVTTLMSVQEITDLFNRKMKKMTPQDLPEDFRVEKTKETHPSCSADTLSVKVRWGAVGSETLRSVMAFVSIFLTYIDKQRA